MVTEAIGPVFGDLRRQPGQHRRVAHATVGDLDGTDLHGRFVNGQVDLAPDAPLGSAMLAGVPLALTSDLDAGAFDQKMSWLAQAAVRQLRGERLPAPAERREIRHRPVEPCELQQARHEAGRLPQRLAEENLDRQGRLDRGVREGLLSTTLARRCRVLGHTGIGLDRQRPALTQRCIVGQPVQGAVARGRRLRHATQLYRWTPNVDPTQPLHNKAPVTPKNYNFLFRPRLVR